MKLSTILIFVFFSFNTMAQDPLLWKIYHSDGTPTDYEKMMKTLAEADVIFLGEEHNNALAHWLQMQVVSDLYNIAKSDLMIGMEMFEADNQMVLNEYLTGLIPIDKFESDVRLWNNYKTDYKPIIEFSKKNNIPVIATNIPRRYASRVNKEGGLESLSKLSDQAKAFIAPLPIKFDDKFYISLFADMMGHNAAMSKDTAKAGHNEVSPQLLYMSQSQAIKDATMAYFILKNQKKGTKFVHLNGNLHSDNFMGIPAYLKDKNNKLNVVIITTVSVDKPEIFQESNKGQATFLFYVNSKAPKSY